MITTKSDFAFAVRKQYQFLERPSRALWIVVQSDFLYLKGTSTNAILSSIQSSRNQPVELFEGNYNEGLVSRKSTIGYIPMNSEGAFHWKLRKQTLTVASTAKSGYVSLTRGTKEIAWLKRIFIHKLQFNQSKDYYLHWHITCNKVGANCY